MPRTIHTAGTDHSFHVRSPTPRDRFTRKVNDSVGALQTFRRRLALHGIPLVNLIHSWKPVRATPDQCANIMAAVQKCVCQAASDKTGCTSDGNLHERVASLLCPFSRVQLQ